MATEPAAKTWHVHRGLASMLATLLLLLVPSGALHAQVSPSGCHFILGFKTLHDLDPNDIGDCLDNQAFAANGDAQQHTAHGLLAWRKADNWTAFTNGYLTWLNGPSGLVRRLNTGRFSWEGNPDGLPLADNDSTAGPVKPEPVPSLAGAPSVPPSPTARPAPPPTPVPTPAQSPKTASPPSSGGAYSYDY